MLAPAAELHGAESTVPSFLGKWKLHSHSSIEKFGFIFFTWQLRFESRLGEVCAYRVVRTSSSLKVPFSSPRGLPPGRPISLFRLAEHYLSFNPNECVCALLFWGGGGVKSDSRLFNLCHGLVMPFKCNYPLRGTTAADAEDAAGSYLSVYTDADI